MKVCEKNTALLALIASLMMSCVQFNNLCKFMRQGICYGRQPGVTDLQSVFFRHLIIFATVFFQVHGLICWNNLLDLHLNHSVQVDDVLILLMDFRLIQFFFFFNGLEKIIYVIVKLMGKKQSKLLNVKVNWIMLSAVTHSVFGYNFM